MARVLLVDDDPEILQNLEEWLTLEHTVRVASSVPQALATLARGPIPDVVIADYDMPPHKGEALLSIVAACYPNVCRILHTARTDDSVRPEAVSAHEVLTKGRDLRQLSAAIRRCRARS